MTPRCDRVLADGLRDSVFAADQLQHHIRVRVAGHDRRIVKPVDTGQIDAPVFFAVAGGDGDNVDRPATPCRDQIASRYQDIGNRSADRSQPRNGNAQRRRHEAMA